MATIGTFASTGNGFTGQIKTLNLNVKAELVRVDNPSDKGPHSRIFAAANVELGAAWQKVSAEGRDYRSSPPARYVRHRTTAFDEIWIEL